MEAAQKTYQYFRNTLSNAANAAEHQEHKLMQETELEAHTIFRQAANPKKDSHDSDGSPKSLPGIDAPGSTGVIYVMDRASANGYEYDNPEWANFGQGAPEVGPIPGASERPHTIDLAAMGDAVNEYGPTTGIRELRHAVANLYNETYRQGKESKYTYENVCIVPGGRAGLIRIAALIGDVYVAYQVPEYTAYSSMLAAFRRLLPVPTSLSSKDHYKLDIDELHNTITTMGVSVVVMSNPRNPTGQVIKGEELNRLVDLSRQGVTLVLDEFYSWYQYSPELEGKSVSAAAYVDDVNEDPVILLDGLTKNFRLPGWRCCWVVGPKTLIAGLGQAGSFLDGGASHPTQVAAIPLLEPERVQRDKLALQKCFKEKRDHVLKRLADIGLTVQVPPMSTFYVWLDLSNLPHPLNSGLTFFEELLKEKTIVVPGIFFDVNPASRRRLFDSPCAHFVRLSFGPPLPELDRGLDGIERLIKRTKGHFEQHGHLKGATGGYKPSSSAHTHHGSREAKASGS
ncbi:PLP-dependent transferase [Cystobasidium minutum MCA 4210]|uniref:PLP-dependent transferase n=1 Tax=Cystobasidium minutum MCA 4210 TaxID=1397322 RepID=UPI0034CDDD9E|eukprot:jgi/Rhomi1/197690/gm1.5904_g